MDILCTHGFIRHLLIHSANLRLQKGASMDIRAVKAELYRHLTKDPTTSVTYNMPLPAYNTTNTPVRTPTATSPPLSPTPSQCNVSSERTARHDR